MKHTIIIRDTQTRDNASKIVSNVPVDVPHEVAVRPHVKDRSAAQRRLQWLWNTEVGNHLGSSKDKTHYDFKEKFAVPMFTRDDKEYAQMVESIKAVRKTGQNKIADDLKKWIIEHTSTTKFNKTQMSEYLTDIENFALEIGAPITFPEDMYEEAMKKNAPR